MKVKIFFLFLIIIVFASFFVYNVFEIEVGDLPGKLVTLEPITDLEPNLKVAFIGDHGTRSDSEANLEMMVDEGVDVLVVAGDLAYDGGGSSWGSKCEDCEGRPEEYLEFLTRTLGGDFPIFVATGNHDDDFWLPDGGYSDVFKKYLEDNVPDAECFDDFGSGRNTLDNYGANNVCYYKGLMFVLSSGNYIVSDPQDSVDYLDEVLVDENTLGKNSIWRICVWHNNAVEYNVGDKSSGQVDGLYESCHKHGAFMATGHSHTFSRTKTLEQMFPPTVATGWTDPSELHLQSDEGNDHAHTFVFDSSAAGYSLRDTHGNTGAFLDDGYYASYISQNEALHNNPDLTDTSISSSKETGALIMEFYVDGDMRKARGYYKIIDGRVWDKFEVTSDVGEGGVSSGAVCGNGVVEGDEECDDGGTSNGDGCDSECKGESTDQPVNILVGSEITDIGTVDINLNRRWDMPVLSSDGKEITFTVTQNSGCEVISVERAETGMGGKAIVVREGGSFSCDDLARYVEVKIELSEAISLDDLKIYQKQVNNGDVFEDEDYYPRTFIIYPPECGKYTQNDDKVSCCQAYLDDATADYDSELEECKGGDGGTNENNETNVTVENNVTNNVTDGGDGGGSGEVGDDEDELEGGVVGGEENPIPGGGTQEVAEEEDEGGLSNVAYFVIGISALIIVVTIIVLLKIIKGKEDEIVGAFNTS